jgi:ligand-binding sensor domain-containing protein
LASTEAKVQGYGRMWLGQAYYDPVEESWVDTVYRDFEVQDLAVDKLGGLWIGRRDGAYYIPDPRSSPREEWNYYGLEQGLPDDNVLVTEIEADGIVWFGTAGGAARCVVDTGRGPEGTRGPEVTPTPTR